MDENQYNGHPLTKERKVGFLFLLLFAILTVSLGALQLRNTIYGPFVVRQADNELDTNIVLADEATRLQQIDTDRDGLNDYEELYFYETSPYIEDTDSDGLLDKAELDAGGDPLCPEGQDCSGEDVTAQTETTQVGTEIANVATPSEVLGGAGIPGANVPSVTGTAPTFDLDALTSNPALLRQTLLSTGQISQEDLDQISDEDLMKTVQTILQSQGATPPQ